MCCAVFTQDVVEESVQQLVQAAASSGASPVTPVTALDLLLQALQGACIRLNHPGSCCVCFQLMHLLL